MISQLISYRDDKGRLEVEVELDSRPSWHQDPQHPVRRKFVVEEHEMWEGCLTFTALPEGES